MDKKCTVDEEVMLNYNVNCYGMSLDTDKNQN